MSFNVLELHWFRKHYDIIQRLNLRDDLVKVFGEEKTNILFHTINHPQILEILNKHNIQPPKIDHESLGFDFSVAGSIYDTKMLILEIACNNILNDIRSKLTSLVSFDKILESSNEVDSFDSLWFLPSIISREELNLEIIEGRNKVSDIVRFNMYNGCISYYIKFIVLSIIGRCPFNRNNIPKELYDIFREKYIEIGRSAASSEDIEIWTRI